MIAIIDYGAGNLQSVSKALKFIGCDSVITNDREFLRDADKVVLPGVGSFGDAMDSLKKSGLEQPIFDFIDSGKPFLGICLGMQMLFEESEESPGVSGLGILKGKIRKIPAKNGLKVPHIGWNSLKIRKQVGIFRGISPYPYV